MVEQQRLTTEVDPATGANAGEENAVTIDILTIAIVKEVLHVHMGHTGSLRFVLKQNLGQKSCS